MFPFSFQVLVGAILQAENQINGLTAQDELFRIVLERHTHEKIHYFLKLNIKNVFFALGKAIKTSL